MASKYNSPFSVGKRQTLFLDANDPRIQGFEAGISAARAGAEIVVVNTEGGSLRGSSFSAVPRQSSAAASVPKALQPKSEEFVKPGTISNLAASWQVVGGQDVLAITWEFDTTLPENIYVIAFSLKFVKTSNSTTYFTKSEDISTSSVNQKYDMTPEKNGVIFGPITTAITSISVAAQDSFGNTGDYVTIPGPTYNSGLTAPTITVTSIQNGYTVDCTNIGDQPASLDLISIEEYVSNASTEPTGVTYTQVSIGPKTINPITIYTSTTAKRWVKARYTNSSGAYGPYSVASAVTPSPVVNVDNTPPNEVTAVSAVWSGDNIVVSYTLPTTDPGIRFQIGLTAPNSSVGYFYVFPIEGTNNQTATITKADLFNQFGSHYSSYSGVIKSIDAVDNRSAGVSFTVGQRPNPLLGITPTFTTTALVNGYSVSYTLPAGAVYAEVYQKYTSWSGVTPYDSFTGTYASGGASGTNTVTLSNVLSNKGVSVTPLTGFIVIGTGIPENTYITAVSGNQITVNNNFTAQVSGSITGYGIVYSGTSPANISSTLYQNTYLLVRYYDDFENPSNYSAEQVVVPLQPVAVDISGPGNVATVAASTSGIDTSGTLGFNGYINLNWTAVSDTTLRGYRIRFTTDTSNPVYSYVDFPIDQANPPTGTISYKLIGLAVGATYKIGVATYDEYNNTSSAYTSFADVTITGTPALSNYIESGTAGFQFGSGIKDKTGVQNASAQGIYLSNSNYWYLTSANSAQFKVGGPSANYLEWNGTKLTVDGDITAKGGSFAGNVALTTSGASIYSGDVTTSPGNLTGDGFIFNKDGLLIRKGSNQVSLDTTNGAITANAGNIADWVISASKIEKLDPGSTRYAGLSSTGTYKFWAGSTVAGGDTTQFAVNGNGKVWAQDIQISGGSLDIGPAAPNGFHVNSSGVLTASSVSLTGEIKASSGKITGNFQVESPGVFYAGSLTGSRVAISSAGLSAFDSSPTPVQTTSIVSNATAGAPTFTTDAAKIGGWYVDSASIKNSSSPSTDGTFTIHSSGNITLFNTGTPNWKVLFSAANAGTDEVLVGGTWNNSTSNWSTKNFILTANGSLTVRNADLIGGTLSVTGGSETMKFGNSVNGALNGIYIDPNDYWYSNGSFSLGSGIVSGTASSVDLNLSSGNGIRFLNMPSDDDDNFSGDPTVTIRDGLQGTNPNTGQPYTDYKLVRGRRFIYNGAVPGNPTSWNSTSKTGLFTTASGRLTEVKVGDIVMIY